MSPFETKTLLQQILRSHDQVIASGDTPATSFPNDSVDQSQKSCHILKITCRSAGFFSGNFAEISIFRDDMPVALPFITGRGVNLVAVDPFDGGIIVACNYDLHHSHQECEQFVKALNNLDLGTIVVLVSKDDCTENLSEKALEAIESIGATKIRAVKYRDSYCCVGQKGAPSGGIIEMHQDASMGPTEYLEKSYDLMQPHGLVSRKGTLLATILPSSGWWIRRRRNDGALNRVPNNFYPKVWHLLSKTKNIRIGNALLSSDPTISESTPEELNFGNVN